MTVRLLSDVGIDSMVATVLGRLTSTARAVVLDLVAGGGQSVPGRLIMIRPNADGSWTGRFPSVRSLSAQYWWVPAGSSPTPTITDGWISSDWVAALGDQPTASPGMSPFGTAPFGTAPFGI